MLFWRFVALWARTLKSAKGAARTTKRPRNSLAPRSVLREFLARRERNMYSDDPVEVYRNEVCKVPPLVKANWLV